MRSSWKLLLLITVVMAATLAAGWYHIAGTPHYSLYKLSEAIRSHDIESAERYIDISRIADDATETIANAKLSQLRLSENVSPLEQLAQEIAKGAVGLMLPTIKARARDEWRTELTKIIEGEERDKLDFLPPSGAQEVYNEFKVNRDQKIASITYNDPKQGVIKFKMIQKSDRTWKIVFLDREWLIQWVQDSPVRNIKTSTIDEIGPEKWVVMVGCAGYAEGTERCKTEEQYRWLKSLRDRHPKFIAYIEFWESKKMTMNMSPEDIRQRKSGLIVYQAVNQLRPDVFLRFASAFVGPFESRMAGETWISWVNSLGFSSDGYDFQTWEVIQHIGHVEPEQKALSLSKKVEGAIIEASYYRRYGDFTLATDSGEQISFSVETGFPGAPAPEDKGKRYSVEFREVTYKRAGPVIKKELEIVKIQRVETREALPQK